MGKFSHAQIAELSESIIGVTPVLFREAYTVEHDGQQNFPALTYTPREGSAVLAYVTMPPLNRFTYVPYGVDWQILNGGFYWKDTSLVAGDRIEVVYTY
jgi:hypothetical protein